VLVSVVIESAPPTANSTPRRRRRWPWVVAGVGVLALIGAGIGTVVYARTYQPLRPGFAFGPQTSSIDAIGDGVSRTRYLLVGPTGTRGVMDVGVENDGRHAVRIDGLDGSDPAFAVSDARWADLSLHNPGGGAELGTIAESRAFPVTVHPGEAIFVQVYLRKPSCAGDDDAELTAIPLRWSAFGVHHVWQMGLDTLPGSSLPIDLCPSKSALAHIDNS
jgi:hypothetical protein